MPAAIEFLCENDGPRLDQFLGLRLPAQRLDSIRRAIKAGRVSVNGRATRHGDWVLRAGDTVSYKPEQDLAGFARDSAAPALAVLYEDADLLIVNKPAGMLSHPSPQEKRGTLLDAAAAYLLRQGGERAARPFLAHRLDRDTSGVVVLARHEQAARALNQDFAEHRARKHYLALVNGVMTQDAGAIDAPIAATPKLWPRWRVQEGGATALTKFSVVRRFARHTLASLEPLTGRTHQLRVHCAHVGHAIVGERIYRGDSSAPVPGFAAQRQLLHAERIVLPHPATGKELVVSAPGPEDLTAAVEILAKG